jgi:hypothetical protein
LGVSPAARYAGALPVLAAHGLVPGPGGFDPGALVAFAAARGWTATAERRPRPRGTLAWRATAFASAPPAGGAAATVLGVYGSGATEAEALAIALASMLRRRG